MRVTRLSAARHRSTACAAVAVVVAVAAPLPKEIYKAKQDGKPPLGLAVGRAIARAVLTQHGHGQYEESIYSVHRWTAPSFAS